MKSCEAEKVLEVQQASERTFAVLDSDINNGCYKNGFGSCRIRFPISILLPLMTVTSFILISFIGTHGEEMEQRSISSKQFAFDSDNAAANRATKGAAVAIVQYDARSPSTTDLSKEYWSASFLINSIYAKENNARLFYFMDTTGTNRCVSRKINWCKVFALLHMFENPEKYLEGVGVVVYLDSDAIVTTKKSLSEVLDSYKKTDDSLVFFDTDVGGRPLCSGVAFFDIRKNRVEAIKEIKRFLFNWFTNPAKGSLSHWPTDQRIVHKIYEDTFGGNYHRMIVEMLAHRPQPSTPIHHFTLKKKELCLIYQKMRTKKVQQFESKFIENNVYRTNLQDIYSDMPTNFHK